MLMLQFLDVVTVKITIVFLLPCSTCAVIASGAFAVGFAQGWKFAHQFSEQIARFLRKKNE